jgi:glycosyltransferase involved in cell wall biosynthesis
MEGNYFLIEVSFEAGNKVGGIWTVLTSKSTYIKTAFGSNYLAIGFYNPTQAAVEFIETPAPQYVKDALADFKLDGVKVYFGQWVPGSNNNIILLDTKDFEKNHVNDIKREFWDAFKIDSLNSPEDYNEPLAWSYAAGALAEALNKHIGIRTVIQAHEWLSGGTVLYLKAKQAKIPTVFTAHATVLGRAYSYGGNDVMSFINENLSVSNSMPYQYGVAAKHFTEKAAASNATVFTVVSEIVKKEAIVMLGKKADFVTTNGIDLINLPNEEELSTMRVNAKEKFASFINSYFLPYYDFNGKEAKVFITSGRYEFYDKGFDLFIDALGKLDKMLTDDNYIIALIAVPTGTYGLKNEVVANYLTYLSIKSSLDEDVRNFDELVASEPSVTTTNLDKAYSKILNDARRLTLQLRRPKPTNPPICPFILSYPEQTDAILNKLKDNGLENDVKNKIKVIFYPKYLTVGDELLNMTYNEVITLATAGFFLSKYEPFGYTPIEAASHMSIAFTTDHSGLAECCLTMQKREINGIIIEKLTGKKHDDIVLQTAEDMLKIAMMSDDDVFRLKLAAKKTAENFGWDKFIQNYFDAYGSALKKI